MVWLTKEDAHDFATVEDLVRMTGCALSTARRWKAQPHTMPESARRLVGYHVCHDLAILWGKDWEHFKFIDGQLVAPFWRRGFTPREILGMFYRVQQVSGLESDVRLLKRDLERERARCEVLERDNYFYRKQVKSEARYGLMFARMFA